MLCAFSLPCVYNTTTDPSSNPVLFSASDDEEPPSPAQSDDGAMIDQGDAGRVGPIGGMNVDNMRAPARGRGVEAAASRGGAPATGGGDHHSTTGRGVYNLSMFVLNIDGTPHMCIAITPDLMNFYVTTLQILVAQMVMAAFTLEWESGSQTPSLLRASSGTPATLQSSPS